MSNFMELNFDPLCKHISEAIQTGFISFNNQLDIVDYTPATTNLVHLEPSIDKTIARGTDIKVWKSWEDLINTSLSQNKKADFGTVKYFFNDQIKLLNITCIPIADPISNDIAGGIIALYDIKEKLDIEQELAHAERLIAIGKVAGKVAHELNNPLDGILRYVNLSLRTIMQGEPERATNYLEHCRNGLQRMAQIITELLEFSRSTHLAFEMSPADKLLDDALRALETSLQNVQVQLIRDYSGPVPYLKSDSVFQVFCNLIKNATDAMQGHGHLTITIRQTDSDWQIEFLDTGPGFDPAAIEDMFKPFYTTKPFGRGTGLGLAICKDLLAKLNGSLSAVNAPSGGGVFTVHLPLSHVNLKRR